MPTITIRNGNRTLKLTKTERSALDKAHLTMIDIQRDFQPLQPALLGAIEGIVALKHYLDYDEVPEANGKPAA